MAFSAFEIALAKSSYETGEIAAKTIGYNIGSKVGGYAGGVIGGGLALLSKAGTQYTSYFYAAGYGFGSYYGGDIGEYMAIYIYKLGYQSYQIQRFMSQYNFNDPALLLQYEQNNIYW